MSEEGIPQNESEQEEKQSDASPNPEEKSKEETEKVSVASAETGGEEPKEEEQQQVQLEVAISDADVNIIGEPEGELPTKVTDEEAVPVPMPSSEDKEENIIAEETENKVIEEEVGGEKVEEDDGIGEGEGEGGAEGEGKGEGEGEGGAEGEGKGEGVGEGKGEGEGEGEGTGEGEGEGTGEGEGEGDGEGKGEGEDEVEGDAEGEGEGEPEGEAEVEGEVEEEEGEAEGEGEDEMDFMELATKLSVISKEKKSILTADDLFQGALEAATSKSTVDTDHLIFDPMFATSRMSEFPARVQIREGISEMTEQEEESKISTPSEETIPEEEEEVPIDREPYFELYANLIKQRPFLKMKNNFLQRKMAEYFKSRKMEHVLRESDRIGDAETKYLKKLDALWELRNVNNLQREAITEELNEMRETRNNQLASVTMNFEQMLSREHEIGTGLIYTKTAKEIPEKFLERLLKNQRMKSKEIEEMRLAYIRIRDAVNEVQAKIRAMDRIGEHYTLIDYEQLKMENQSHADKIEERDAELEKLREKYSSAIQCLAHFREKSNNTNIEIEDMQEKFQDVEIDRNNCRERVNSIKQDRDSLRSEILKLQENSGLLAKPKLLLDLQETLEMVVESKRELDEMKEQFAKNTVMLEALKKNMEEEKDRFHLRKFNLKEQKKLVKNKSRLAYPSLERFNVTEFEERFNNNK